jgi:hypothetical protein
MAGREMCTKFRRGTVKHGDQEDRGIDGRIILKWVQNNRLVRC